MALDVLCSTVPPGMVTVIANKDTTKEAWDAISTMCVGNDLVKKNTAQQLRREFELATFKDGDMVEDYALRLTSTVATLATLGEVVEESKVVEKMLCSVPSRFKQIMIAPMTRRVHVIRDVVFDEGAHWDWSSEEGGGVRRILHYGVHGRAWARRAGMGVCSNANISTRHARGNGHHSVDSNSCHCNADVNTSNILHTSNSVCLATYGAG
jgi:hypothetical protein